MPTHLSCLGFRVTDQDSLEDLLLRLAEDSEQLPCAEGVYLRWRSEEGPEMWLLYRSGEGLVGFSPHFHGEARVRAQRARSFARPRRTPLEGALAVRSAAAGRSGVPLGVDLVVDMPDFRIGGRLVGDEPVQLQITAFAHDIHCWESATAYAASDDAASLDVGSFVATGLASDRTGEADADPEPQAVFVGTVQATGHLENPVGGSFVWARAATDLGSFDVVADPELLDEPLTEGGVIRGRFWLSGRVREYVERRASGLSLNVFRG